METEVPHAKSGRICPFHRKDMSKVCHTCPMWVRMTGRNPNAKVADDPGEIIDRWDCSLAWGPMLMTQTSKEVFTVACEVNQMRGEAQAAHEHTMGANRSLVHASVDAANALNTIAKNAEQQTKALTHIVERAEQQALSGQQMRELPNYGEH